jgi:hypothetical protein
VLSKNLFLTGIESLLLMSFWFIGILFIKNLFSSELTAKLGLKTPVKQIDTIEELVNSNIKFILPNSFTPDVNQSLSLKIYNKAMNEGKLLRLNEILSQDKWIKGVAAGGNAIFIYEVPAKTIINNVVHELKENCRLRYLPEDYGPKFSLTVASSKRLDEEFREKLNLRRDKSSLMCSKSTI